MGKLLRSRFTSFRSPAQRHRSPDLQAEFARLWSCGVVSLQQLREDGHVVVTVRFPSNRDGSRNETPMLCRGLANEGNTFPLLVKLLRTKGKIPQRGGTFTFFVRRGFVWEAVTPAKDTFKSGESLLLLVRANNLPSVVNNKLTCARREEATAAAIEWADTA